MQSPLFWLLTAVLTIVVVAVVGLITEQRTASTLALTVIPASFAVAWLAAVVLAFTGWNVARAPYRQRDEARIMVANLEKQGDLQDKREQEARGLALYSSSGQAYLSLLTFLQKYPQAAGDTGKVGEKIDDWHFNAEQYVRNHWGPAEAAVLSSAQGLSLGEYSGTFKSRLRKLDAYIQRLNQLMDTRRPLGQPD